MANHCPHCDFSCHSPGALAKHIEACAKRPTRAALAEMCERGMLQREICDLCMVSDRTVRKWLEEYGLETLRQRQCREKSGKPEPKPKKKVKKHPYSPYFGVMGCPCEKGCASKCHELMKLGGWCLCERPSEEDVAWAKKVGLIERYERLADS